MAKKDREKKRAERAENATPQNIDPYQRARAVKKGRKQEAENGLGAVRARCMSAKFATGAPVTASGCKQQSCRSIEAVPARVW